jgi:RND family efflux transporter MFP subunit
MKHSLLRWAVTLAALLATVAVIVVVAFPGSLGIGGKSETPAGEEEIKGTATVTTVEAAQGSLVPTARADGIVTTSPQHSFVIAVMHDGIFKSVNVRDGETVKAGQTLFTVTTAPANTAAFAQARSAVNFATQDVARIERLLANKQATNDQLATARKALADAQLQLEQQRTTGGGEAEQVMRAPFEGVITGLMATAGDTIKPGEPIATLVSRTDAVVQLNIEPEIAAKVTPGARVKFTAPFQDSKEIIGKLTSIGVTLDKDSHLLKGFADIPAAEAAHLPLGTTLLARIELPARQGLLIPRTALLEDAKGTYLFTVSEDEAKRQDIKVLVETDDMALIDPAGFDPALGTRVVVSGNTELDDDTPVQEEGKPAAEEAKPAAEEAKPAVKEAKP